MSLQSNGRGSFRRQQPRAMAAAFEQPKSRSGPRGKLFVRWRARDVTAAGCAAACEVGGREGSMGSCVGVAWAKPEHQVVQSKARNLFAMGVKLRARNMLHRPHTRLVFHRNVEKTTDSRFGLNARLVCSNQFEIPGVRHMPLASDIRASI